MITFHPHSLKTALSYSLAAALLTTAVFAVLLVQPTTTEAKTVSASDMHSGDLYYRATASKWWDGYVLGLQNPHSTVHYHADVRNVDTGTLLVDGANVKVGTIIAFEPRLGDISWVGTGRSMDTPTGSWVPSAALGEPESTFKWSRRWYSDRRYQRGQCQSKNYLRSIRHTRGKTDVYIPFSVNPPAQSVNVTGSANLTALGGNQYQVDSPGTITAEINFDDTYGRYYYQYHYKYWGCVMSWDVVPMIDYNLVSAFPRYAGLSNTVRVDTDPTPYIYNAQFAAQTINYSLTAVGTPPPSNNPPSYPIVTGESSVVAGNPYTVNFVSTDPDGDNLYYEIDWNDDSIADQRVPSSGYVAEGVSQSVIRTWSTPGSYTVNVRAVDQPGAISNWGWNTFEVTTPSATLDFQVSVNGGAYVASDQTISSTDTLAFQWSTTNVTSCTGTNLNTGGAANNPNLPVATPSSGTIVTYTIDCTATDGTTVTRTLNVTVASVPLPTVTVESRVDGIGSWVAADRTIDAGQFVEMQWSSTNAVSCTGISAPSVNTLAGTTTVSNPVAGTFQDYGVTCFNSDGVPGGGDFRLTVNPPPPVPGCTDSTANNYNASATTDDGSCIYAPVPAITGSGCSDIAIGDSTCDGLVTWKDGDNVYNDTQGAVAYTSANGSNQSISLKRGNNQIQLRDSSNAVLADTSLTASCDSASSVWSAAQNVCAPLPPTVTVDLTVNGGAPTVPFTPTDDVKVEWTSTPTASECQWVDDYGGTLPPISGPNDIVTISPAALALGSTINFAIECRREVSGIASDWAQDSVSGSMAIPTLELSLAQSLVRSGTVTDVTWGVSDITGTGFVLECDLILPGRAPLSDTFTTDRDQTDLTGEVTSVFNVTLSCIETTTGQQIIESERLEVVPTTQEI